VIVTDDGIATGSTMMAALQVINTHSPREVILAVPVAAPDRLEGIRPWCDEVVCLAQPGLFFAVGQFFDDFAEVDDDQVVKLLEQYAAVDHPSD
jgi:predicted phosphoribosyltransferase